MSSSLYIQITDRCNMTCPHCCFACTRKGSDISVAHFDTALTLLGEDELCNMVTIGGGEPTLHRHCMEFIWKTVRQCLSLSEDMGTSVVGIVTNGSVKQRALELALMAKHGLVSARLSYDRFHNLELVDDTVLRAFKAEKLDAYYNEHFSTSCNKEGDLRTINQMDYPVTPHGRAIENNIANHPFTQRDACCCQGLFITPDGRLWQCGCKTKVLGHLDNLSACMDTIYELQDNDDGEIPCSRQKAA